MIGFRINKLLQKWNIIGIGIVAMRGNGSLRQDVIVKRRSLFQGFTGNDISLTVGDNIDGITSQPIGIVSQICQICLECRSRFVGVEFAYIVEKRIKSVWRQIGAGPAEAGKPSLVARPVQPFELLRRL